MLSTLDADGDLILSPVEIHNAPAVLRKLDLDRNGVLDADHDGAIGPAEIDHNPAELQTLDANRDGS
jgi:EF hand